MGAQRTARSAQSANSRRAGAPVSGPKRSKAGRAANPSPATNELDAVFAIVSRYFSLLSEPTRLKILHSICQDERSVSAIVAATGATQTNVSRHLGLMRAAGVVSRRQVGSVVYYRVTDPDFVEICRSVCIRIAGRIDDQKDLRQDLLQFAAGH